MESEELLLIPGPVTVSDGVLEALAEPVRAHYGDAWTALYTEVANDLKAIFGTSGDVFLMFGPGSAAVEMGLASTLAPGDRVLVAGEGFFAERMASIAEANRLQPVRVRPEGYAPLEPEAIAKALEEDPSIRGLALVHHETDLGLVHPLQDLARVGREHGVLVLVDAISSLGGIELEMDAWGIDVVIAVGNKAIGAPIGIAPVAVGSRAWEAVDDGREKAAGWYLNLAVWRRALRDMGNWHPHPTTMPTNVMVALHRALSEFKAEGQASRMEQQAAAARRVRDGMRELGFQMLVTDEAASPLCTAILTPPDLDVPAYLQFMQERFNLHLAGGLGPLRGRLIRIGHMGAGTRPEVVDAVLEGTADYLAATRSAVPT